MEETNARPSIAEIRTGHVDKVNSIQYWNNLVSFYHSSEFYSTTIQVNPIFDKPYFSEEEWICIKTERMDKAQVSMLTSLKLPHQLHQAF